MAKIEEKNEFKLLVEGNDEQQVIYKLFEKLELPLNFDVIDCQSIEKVKENLKVRIKATNDTKRLGIIIDADNKPLDRWKSIQNILAKQEQYIIPYSLPKEGLILKPKDEEEIAIGVWIMPDNQLEGMLEDFLAALIPAEDKLLTYVDKAMAEIEADKVRKYKDVHKAKARMHTWLAWQETPGTPLGRAITKTYLSTDVAACKAFVNWLSGLFKE